MGILLPTGLIVPNRKKILVMDLLLTKEGNSVRQKVRSEGTIQDSIGLFGLVKAIGTNVSCRGNFGVENRILRN